MSTEEEDCDALPDFKVKSRPVMSKAAKLDKLMEKKRYTDYLDESPFEFRQKVQTINFALNDDCINGVFEVDSNSEQEEQAAE